LHYKQRTNKRELFIRVKCGKKKKKSCVGEKEKRERDGWVTRIEEEAQTLSVCVFGCQCHCLWLLLLTTSLSPIQISTSHFTIFLLLYYYYYSIIILIIINIIITVIKLNGLRNKIIKYGSEREIWWRVKIKRGKDKMSSDSALPFFQDKLFLFSL